MGSLRQKQQKQLKTKTTHTYTKSHTYTHIHKITHLHTYTHIHTFISKHTHTHNNKLIQSKPDVQAINKTTTRCVVYYLKPSTLFFSSKHLCVEINYFTKYLFLVVNKKQMKITIT